MQEVEPFGPQALETSLARCKRPMPRRVLRQHLAHQEDLVPPASNRFAHKRFRSAIAVHFRRVDQRYPEIDPKLDCLDLAGVPTWLFGEMLRAMAQHRDHIPRREFLSCERVSCWLWSLSCECPHFSFPRGEGGTAALFGRIRSVLARLREELDYLPVERGDVDRNG